MTTHHAQTALRLLEGYPDDGPTAIVHAQLETAEQLERLANMAERAAVGVEAMKSLTQDIGKTVEEFFGPNGPAKDALTFIARMFGFRQ